jgi:transposase
VPEGHLAHLVRDTVRTALDLSAILSSYEEDRGYPPYHPGMMTALLLYAYSQGVYSSRRIARGCEERLDFAAVTGMQRPDFRTIAEFRKRHLKALSGLFVQVLQLCKEAGLVKLGHVALDGTKLKANASKHKAQSYGRMAGAEAALKAEVDAWMAKAGTADQTEDRQNGAERRGDELPAWVANKQRRLEKIRAAKAALEAEAKAAEPPDGPGAEASDGGSKKRKGGRPPARPPGTPSDKAQRNFTDPESRIMKTRDGFIQGYNAQAAVDAEHQIIVGQMLTDKGADTEHLPAVVDQIKANLGSAPSELSADAGYCSEANLVALEEREIEALVATGRQKHGTAAPAEKPDAAPESRVAKMGAKLKAAGFTGPYRLRKQTVEPVFGQIKHARGFRQFLLRGTEKVSGEWSLICTVHNLLKLLTHAETQPMPA